MRALERFLLLQIIDQRWREHLYDMDYLREGIHLRGFAQIEPLVAYKNEAFELFRDLMNSVWGDFARMIFHVEVTVEGEERRGPAARHAAAERELELVDRRPQRDLLGWRNGAAERARDGRGERRRGDGGGYGEDDRRRRRSSSSAASTRPSRSAATTRAGAGRARSTRSATGPEPSPERMTTVASRLRRGPRDGAAAGDPRALRRRSAERRRAERPAERRLQRADGHRASGGPDRPAGAAGRRAGRARPAPQPAPAPAAAGGRRRRRGVSGLHRDLGRQRAPRPVLADLGRADRPDPAAAQRLAAVRAVARARPRRGGAGQAPAAAQPPWLTPARPPPSRRRASP